MTRLLDEWTGSGQQVAQFHGRYMMMMMMMMTTMMENNINTTMAQ
jgi:hypothetical protein